MKTTCLTPAHNYGFSILEILVTISLLTVLASWSIPSFMNQLQRNAVESSAQNLLGDLQLARANAISNKRWTYVCPSANVNAETPECSNDADWSQGWLVYEKQSANSHTAPFVSTNDRLIKRHVPSNSDLSNAIAIAGSSGMPYGYSRNGMGGGVRSFRLDHHAALSEENPSSAPSICLDVAFVGSLDLGACSS